MTDSESDPDISDLDIDIDLSLVNPEDILTPEAKRQRQIAAIQNAWTPVQSILYVQELACQNCGTVHTLPNDRLLTEWKHVDGVRKWASSQHVKPDLPIVQRKLDGKLIPMCHVCTPPETENS